MAPVVYFGEVAMKVQIASLSLHGPVLVGEFLGLYSDEYDDTSVVVRLPGNGLYLDVICTAYPAVWL